jgi:hypothetical protein
MRAGPPGREQGQAGDGGQGPPGGRETMRMLLPSFVVSAVLVVVGIVLVLAHHRSIGLFLMVLAAAVGFVVRLRLMLRAQRR